MISHMEKVKAYEWVLRLPSQVRCCPRGPFLLHPIQSTESWAALLGVGKMLREWQRGVSEGLRGMWIRILFTASWTPSRSLPNSHWGSLTRASSQLAHGHPQCSVQLTTHTLNCAASSLCTLLMEANKLWLMASEHCRKSASICRPGSNH